MVTRGSHQVEALLAVDLVIQQPLPIIDIMTATALVMNVVATIAAAELEAAIFKVVVVLALYSFVWKKRGKLEDVFQGIALQAVLAFFKAYQSISLQPTGHECGTLSSKVLQNVGFGPV